MVNINESFQTPIQFRRRTHHRNTHNLKHGSYPILSSKRTIYKRRLHLIRLPSHNQRPSNPNSQTNFSPPLTTSWTKLQTNKLTKRIQQNRFLTKSKKQQRLPSKKRITLYPIRPFPFILPLTFQLREWKSLYSLSSSPFILQRRLLNNFHL